MVSGIFVLQNPKGAATGFWELVRMGQKGYGRPLGISAHRVDARSDESQPSNNIISHLESECRIFLSMIFRRFATLNLDTRFIIVLDFDRRKKHGFSLTGAFLIPSS